MGGGGAAFGEPEADVHRERGRDVREVVQRVAQECDGAPEERDRELEQSGEAEPAGRDANCTVGRRALLLVVGCDGRVRVPNHFAEGKQVHESLLAPESQSDPAVRARCEVFVAAQSS
jgi:hypothetical protein